MCEAMPKPKPNLSLASSGASVSRVFGVFAHPSLIRSETNCHLNQYHSPISWFSRPYHPSIGDGQAHCGAGMAHLIPSVSVHRSIAMKKTDCSGAHSCSRETSAHILFFSKHSLRSLLFDFVSSLIVSISYHGFNQSPEWPLSLSTSEDDDAIAKLRF